MCYWISAGLVILFFKVDSAIRMENDDNFLSYLGGKQDIVAVVQGDQREKKKKRKNRK